MMEINWKVLIHLIKEEVKIANKLYQEEENNSNKEIRMKVRIIMTKIMILIRFCRWGSNIKICCRNYKLKFHFTLKSLQSQYLKS